MRRQIISTTDLNNWIDSLLNKYVAESKIVGMGASVIAQNVVVMSKGYGYMDLENQIDFTPDTIINIGSVSKVVTGASVLHAYHTEGVSVHDPINAFLPFAIDKEVTFQHLATHTSCINDIDKIYQDSYYYGADSPIPLGEFLKSYLSRGGELYSEDNYLSHPPGEFWQYSNIAAGLEGYLVECITDTALNAYSKKCFFEPLGMTSTGWFLSEIDTTRHSKLYEYIENNNYKTFPKYGLTTYPDGGLRTSINDLSKFLVFLANKGKHQNNQVLCESLVEMMFARQFETGELDKYFQFDDVNNWGLNLEINELDNGEIVIGHSGSDPGVATQMWYNLNTKVGLILFINTRNFEYDYQLNTVNALWEFGNAYNRAISG
jgi:CubicO group peptidase (beta-lactamase class C family)